MATDKNVQVKFSAGGSARDTAQLLLGAADEKGVDTSVVQTGSYGTFSVPESVAKAAGLDYEKEEGVDNPEVQEIEATADDTQPTPHVSADDVSTEDPAPAKKAAAKKTTAKKAAAKKTAKKTAKKS